MHIPPTARHQNQSEHPQEMKRHLNGQNGIEVLPAMSAMLSCRRHTTSGRSTGETADQAWHGRDGRHQTGRLEGEALP